MDPCTTALCPSTHSAGTSDRSALGLDRCKTTNLAGLVLLAFRQRRDIVGAFVEGLSWLSV